MQGTGRGSLHNPLLQICLTMAQSVPELQVHQNAVATVYAYERASVSTAR